MKRRICVFTGTRAEYGLLRPLMAEIKRDRSLTLQIVASGTHLDAGFGSTYREIVSDGFRIDAKVKLPLESDSPVGIASAVASALKGICLAYERLRPDIVVVLGDRYEALAAAEAAMISRIPIAHINGGEATFGLIDEAIRHSISKMSHLHFTATDEYRDRVIQLGEDPKRVFCTGALGIDNINGIKLLSRQDLERELGIRLDKRNLVVTFHPVTLEKDTSRAQFANLLAALDGLSDTTVIFTKANADTDGRIINRMIDDYAARHPEKARAFASLGQLRYLSALKYADAVVGNSSSGIIEAPSFRIGTVNIGMRQAGRIRTRSVIDCEPVKASIERAIKQACSSGFKRQLRALVNPYGDGRAAARIKKVLKEADLDGILIKRFHDLAISGPR